MDIPGNPQHRAMIRESQLAAGQIAAGVTALAKANHACTAYYHQAFFGLSIGIERLCKQIFIADYAITNGGSFPTFREVREFGHNLEDLLLACDEIGKRFKPTREHAARPDTDIHRAIATALSSFADGTRYSNLNFLTSHSNNTEDPVSAWWLNVGVPVCKRHYSKRAEMKDALQAMLLGAMIQDHAMFHYTSESGEHIGDFEALATRAGATRVVQKYGKMYVLQIVRWLRSLAEELAMTGGYTKQIPSLFCFHEPYNILIGTDADFLRKKRFDFNAG